MSVAVVTPLTVVGLASSGDGQTFARELSSAARMRPTRPAYRGGWGWSGGLVAVCRQEQNERIVLGALKAKVGPVRDAEDVCVLNYAVTNDAGAPISPPRNSRLLAGKRF